MKPAAFQYLRPESLEQALAQLAETDGARPISGGQSFGPMLNMRLATPAALIDLNDLTELAYVREVGDTLEVGALSRHYQLAESALLRRACPLLVQAARTIGHYAIRQRGTLGGSLAHADPAAQLALVAVTLGAQLELVSARGQRSLAATDFFEGVMATALAPDELIRCVRFPRFEPGTGSAFVHFNRRHGDFAIVAVAVTVTVQAGRVTALRLGVGGTSPAPLDLSALAPQFCGRVADGDWAEQLARAAREAVAPQEDARVPAAYRRELVETLVRRALLRALGNTTGNNA